MSVSELEQPGDGRANILVVDDLPDKLLVFETILAELGQNLVFARSGSEALAEVLKRQFAVILLDVNMPDIDGLETAGYIRQYRKSAHTPIIFITAYADEMQTAKGYSLGAVDYILSPIQPEVLRSKVKVFVQLYQLQQQAQLVARERIALEQAESARQAAEEASRLKDEFIAVLSHELRNPLAPIRSAVEVIRRVAPPDPKLAQATGMLERQVASLMRLVDELLDVARMGRGRISLKKERLELEQVIAHGIEAVRPMLESRQQTLAVTVPAAPIWISGDLIRLGQVIANLVSNASKYSPERGRIEIEACARQGQAVVAVRDFGDGIEPELLPRVFDLFVQGARSLDRSQGGMGIGLTLSRHLVELHKGRIEASSDGVGKGAVFTVRLPCINAITETPGAVLAYEAPQKVRPRRVLILDDNVDAAEGIAMVLRLSGHEVKVMNDPQEAIASARVFAPHAMVLDIGMPIMDGYQVAQTLRREGHTDVLLIALTGYGQPRDREKSMAAGFDLHFVKPVRAADLEMALQSIRSYSEPQDVLRHGRPEGPSRL